MGVSRTRVNLLKKLYLNRRKFEMSYLRRVCPYYSGVVLVSTMLIPLYTSNSFIDFDKKYYLVAEAYNVAKDLFIQGRNNFDELKNRSLRTIDTFLDLVQIMNDEMARELRSAIVKFYRIKFFHDFTNYVISLEEIMNITEHCLKDPVEKLELIRNLFHQVIVNFEDIRNFDTLFKCRDELPDEVAAAHCILHQAMLFNETMQEGLTTIVEIKTRQHAQDMNTSLYGVQKCFGDFVPKFFEQLLVDAYTDNCGYLKVVNASIHDFLNDEWRSNEQVFPIKWSPLVKILREKLQPSQQTIQEPSLHLSLFAADLSFEDVAKSIF